MKKTMMLAAIAVVGLTSVSFAQSEADYPTYMKTIAGANGALGKDIMAKDSMAAAADAQKMADTFKMVEAFWKGRNVDDAVGFAQKAGAAATATAKAAAAGNFDEAAADQKTILPNCGGCHMAHREKTDAGFKIKQ